MRTSSCLAGFTLATVTSRRWFLVVALAASLAAIPSNAGAAPTKHRLKAFGSCSRFVHYARRHAVGELSTRGTPIGPPLPVRSPQRDNSGPVAPQAEGAPTSGGGAAGDFWQTNNQEAGVDERDFVKPDGKRIFVAENGRLYALDARSDPPRLLSSIALGGSAPQDLLLAGDRLLV